MKSSDSTTQTLGTAFVLSLSRSLPPSIGYPLASVVSYILGNLVFSPTFRAICANQWVVHGGKMRPIELRKAIRKVYQHQGRALYDFYHNLDNPDQIKKFVHFSPGFQQLVNECMSGTINQGTLLLMPHLSGFNISGLALAQTGFKFLTLAIPNPNKGYAWQNKLRNDRGMQVLPMNMEAMQLARKKLQQGGVVLTGVDRPVESSEYQPLFFGRLASLPVAYIKLAMRTNSRVFAIRFKNLPDHTCLVDVSPQIEMEKEKDPQSELILNAQKVLKVIEGFIREDPSQWMMFLPVWKDVLKEIPIL